MPPNGVTHPVVRPLFLAITALLAPNARTTAESKLLTELRGLRPWQLGCVSKTRLALTDDLGP